MAKMINTGESFSFEIRNKSVYGIRMNIYAQHASVNTNFVSGDFLLEKISCRVAKVLANGRKIEMYNGDLRSWLALSQWGTNAFQAANAAITQARTIQAKGVAADEIINIPLEVHFLPSKNPILGIQNLKPGESIMVQIINDTSAYGANVSPSETWMYIEEIEGIGYQLGVPQIFIDPIQSSKDTYSNSLGNGVFRALWYNTDKTDYIGSTRVITSGSIDSDKKNYNFDFYSLINRQLDGMELPTSQNLYQSFPLLDEVKECNDVEVSISMQSAQVAANKNYVLASRLVPNGQDVAYSKRLMQKHQAQDAVKYGISSTR